MDLNLKNKHALITGASKGIGLAVAKSLAGEGCNIHLAARNEDSLVTVANDISNSYDVKVDIHVADLSAAKDRSKLANDCKNIDILINNAGSIPSGGLEEIDDERLRDAWELKLFGYIHLTRELYALMKARGSGVVINVIGSAADNPNYNAIEVVNEFQSQVINGFCEYTVVAEVNEKWSLVNNDNFHELADFEGYKKSFRNLFGFEVDDVDYSQPVETEVTIPLV